MVGKSRYRSLRRAGLLLSSLVLLVGAGTYARARLQLSRRAAAGQAPLIVRPERRKIGANVLATGTVRLKVGAQVRVGAQLSGIVKKLKVSVGSRVRKGDVIAEIDTRNVEARIAQARAQVRQDEVDLAKTRRDLARGRALLADGLIPNQQAEELEWSVESAKAKLEKARADLAAARVDLVYATIRTPISGTVASVSTQEGETVAASFTAPTFVTVVEGGALELIAMVDEVDIAGVAPGEPVSFTVEAYASNDFSGVVERVNPTATIVSGVVNYEVVVAIKDAARLLKPDMTANVSILTAQREALVVPDAAVHSEGEGNFVYLVENGRVQKRSVSIGSRAASYTEIKRGLTGGERVVCDLPAQPKTAEGP